MCGLFGFSGAYPADLTKLRWLAVMNESRGRHSTGVFAYKNNKTKDTVLYKDAVAASEFVKKGYANDAMRGAFTLLGHTRAATKGIINVNNSHPFQYSIKTKVVGAHNGFISDAFVKRYIKEFALEKTFPSGDTDVDSQIIFSVLSQVDGDFHVLSKLEGGIVTLFTMPEKYGNVLFAYKREARDLHYGLTSEGIYLSSEKLPLEMIGCTKVESLKNDSLTLFKDGHILDIVDMEKPKIHVEVNQSRIDFGANVTVEARNIYKDELPVVVKYKNNRYTDMDDWYRSQKYPNSRKSPPKEVDDYDDRLQAIIMETLDDISLFETEQYKQLVSAEPLWISVDEMQDALVFIQVTESSHKEALIGWTVHDSSDTAIAAITGLNGSVVLRYKPKDCGERKLIIYDPIDGSLAYTLTVNPKSGRVMEVALQVPFLEENNKEETSGNKGDKRSSDNFIVATGEYLESKFLTSDECKSIQLASRTKLIGPLQKQQEEIHSRHPTEETNGSVQYTAYKGDDKAIGATISEKRNRTFTRKEIESVRMLSAARFCSPKVNLDVDKKVEDAPDTISVKNVLNEYLGSLIHVDALIRDAIQLKLHEAHVNNASRAISYYTILLLDYVVTPADLKMCFNGAMKVYASDLFNPVPALGWTYIRQPQTIGFFKNETQIKKFLNAYEIGVIKPTAEVSEKKLGKLSHPRTFSRMTMQKDLPAGD